MCPQGPPQGKDQRADLQIEEQVRDIRTVLRGCLPAPGGGAALPGLHVRVLERPDAARTSGSTFLAMFASSGGRTRARCWRALTWELTPPGPGTQAPTASQTPMLLSWLALPNLPTPPGTPPPTAQAILPSLTSGLTLYLTCVYL